MVLLSVSRFMLQLFVGGHIVEDAGVSHFPAEFLRGRPGIDSGCLESFVSEHVLQIQHVPALLQIVDCE